MKNDQYNYSSERTYKEAILAACNDIKSAIIGRQSWILLGISELQQRYQRSTIGPFWVTLSMGVQTFVMGVLLAFLFNQEINRFLPFISISLILWTFFSSVINEGAVCFTGMSGIILQVNRPLSSFLFLIIWRHLLIFFHTIWIFFIVLLLFQIQPSKSYLLIPLGLFLFIVNVGWMALLCGIISARYRDIPPIIQNSLNILVWITPVYYQISQVGNKGKFIVSLNPITYIFEVARGPFLNTPPALSVWIISSLVAVVGWVFVLIFFAKFRSRIPYWL
jgi:ABC-type polysaccharide/polyol phosphate export permease